MQRPFYKELVQFSPEPCQLAHFTDKKIEDWREYITLPQLIENYHCKCNFEFISGRLLYFWFHRGNYAK